MAQHPLENILAVAAVGGAWTNCGGNRTCRRLEVVETPTAAQAATQTYTPQGLTYQLWDPGLNNGSGGWGTSKNLLPGDLLVVSEAIPPGKAGSPVIGMAQQTNPGGHTTGPIYPARVTSSTATTTQVLVREYE